MSIKFTWDITRTCSQKHTQVAISKNVRTSKKANSITFLVLYHIKLLNCKLKYSCFLLMQTKLKTTSVNQHVLNLLTIYVHISLLKQKIIPIQPNFWLNTGVRWLKSNLWASNMLELIYLYFPPSSYLILDGTTVENKGELILTEIFPSMQKHDI